MITAAVAPAFIFRVRVIRVSLFGCRSPRMNCMSEVDYRRSTVTGSPRSWDITAAACASGPVVQKR